MRYICMTNTKGQFMSFKELVKEVKALMERRLSVYDMAHRLCVSESQIDRAIKIIRH